MWIKAIVHYGQGLLHDWFRSYSPASCMIFFFLFFFSMHLVWVSQLDGLVCLAYITVRTLFLHYALYSHIGLPIYCSLSCHTFWVGMHMLIPSSQMMLPAQAIQAHVLVRNWNGANRILFCHPKRKWWNGNTPFQHIVQCKILQVMSMLLRILPYSACKFSHKILSVVVTEKWIMDLLMQLDV